MSDITENNYMRKYRASEAILYYKKELLCEGGEANDDEDVIDLLTDVMHLLGNRFDQRLQMALMHYEAEK